MQAVPTRRFAQRCGASALGRATILLLPGFLVVRGALAWEPPNEADHALPCRPTIACTADLVPPGTLEVEAGLIGKHLGGSTTQAGTPILAKLTVQPDLQLQLGSNGYIVQQGDPAGEYVDNIVAGAKLHLLDQTEAQPSLAVSAAIGVPVSADQAAFTRAYDAFFTGYATRDFARLHVDANLGLNIWRIDGAALTQPWGAIAVSTDLRDRWTGMVETYAYADASPLAPRDGGLLVALAYAVHPWLIVDGGGDYGFVPSNRQMSLFVGLTWIPAVLWRPQPVASGMRSP